jgi:uncharacterized repeat protein (TIGR01451 family)
MMALMTVAVFGVYWAVSAQEAPLFAPPPVLPTDNTKVEKKPVPKVPYQTQPLRDKKKADATLIVPAEVYEAPRPIGPPTQLPEKRPGNATQESGIVQAQGQSSRPAAPLPAPAPNVDKAPSVLPPPPMVETTPLVPPPMPMLDPAKLLIEEPKVKDAPPKKAAPVEIPLPPVRDVPPKTAPVELPLPPAVVPETPKPAPPTIVLPGAAPVEPIQSEKPRTFVRIKPEVLETPPPIVRPGPVFPDPPPGLQPVPQVVRPMPFALPPSVNALLSMQTPSVAVEKRGSPRLQAGETLPYQIVVRNVGPGPAEQVRIEEVLPDSVKIVTADPMPQLQGDKAVWMLPMLSANQEQVLQFTLRSGASSLTLLTNRVSVHVAAGAGAGAQPQTTALRPRELSNAMTVQVTGPNQVAVGKAVVFDVRVHNQSAQPLTGIVLHGQLPEGLDTPQGRDIEGEVDATIPPGEAKTLKMPANAVKPGRWTVTVKVTTQAGHEASATASVEVSAESLQVQQPSATRLYMNRDGDLRIDVTNHTAKPMRNVTVADRLPDGIDFVDANARGLYQANSRVVYWVIDQLMPGQTQSLQVRVNGARAGQHQNVVFAKADGVTERQSAGVISLEGLSDLSMRVIDRDNPLEVGKETVYEIKVQNPGNVPASNVRLQVNFPAGMMPKSAQGKTRFTMDRQGIVFEPIAQLEPSGETTFRVSAQALVVGDQRVRFAVASDEVRVPIQREISTRVYSDRNP